MNIQSFPKIKVFCLLFFGMALLAFLALWLPEGKAQAQTPPPNNIPKLMQAPQPGVSYYMRMGHSNYNTYSLGGTNAQGSIGYAKKGKSLLSTLHFGQPCYYWSGGVKVLGASGYDGCHSINEIEIDVMNFMRGYCNYLSSQYPNRACGYQYTSLPMLTLGVGTSNCTDGGPNCTNPGQGQNVTFEHGQAWAQLVNRLNVFAQTNDYYYQVHIVGANDIELSWDIPVHTRAWVDGYASSTSIDYYNFGACEGCPDRLGNGWTPADVYYVAYGAGPATALPEIYRTDGTNAIQWRALSEYASTQLNQPPILFAGVFTQWQACQPDKCRAASTDNTSYQAAAQLSVEILTSTDLSTRYTVSSIKSASDIRWYP